jgi:beta-lactamase class A
VATQIHRQQAKGLPGTVGVYLTDLASGQSASLNPTATFYGASTLKVPIAMTVLWLLGQNRLTLDETIAYRPEEFQAGTGTLQATVRPGQRIAVRRLLDLMITVSDNIARNILERFIGSGTIRRYMRSIGVTPPYDPAKLPAGVAVANKIGTWPGQVHDIGLVYAPDRSFALSVFTRGIPEAQAEAAIATMAAAIYGYMDALAG